MLRYLSLFALALGVMPAFVGHAGGGTPESARFIVVLKETPATASAAGLRTVARRHAQRFGGRIQHVYPRTLNGYSALLPERQAAAAAADPAVAYVERDVPVDVAGTQLAAPWGLDRIDQRPRTLNGTFAYSATGAGVTAYVIDTGVRISHGEFGGRAISGHDVIDGGAADDCSGHGTHVAATIGGRTYGVAKGVSIVAVRVINCTAASSVAGIIAGVDWVTGHHQSGAPAVANMSLSGNGSLALDTAVRKSIADGITYTIAAGNGSTLGLGVDACSRSPGRVAEAITVGATDRTDRKATWSNRGSCVDLFAPGVGITSAWRTSNTATNIQSGTSMASPHVAGVAALYLETTPGADPATVGRALFDASTKNVVTSAATPNNHLLFTAY